MKSLTEFRNLKPEAVMRAFEAVYQWARGVKSEFDTLRTLIAIAGTTPVAPGAYTTIEDEGTAVAQERILNFIGALVSVTPGAGRTDVTIATPDPQPYVYCWSMPDLKNSTNAFVMDPSEDGSGAGGYSFATLEEEGRGIRVMQIAGTFYSMTARIRGVRGATDCTWTYTMRVNESDTGITDNFNIGTTNGVAQKTTAISQHVSVDDRVTFKSQTSVARSTVSAPWIGVLFLPD